MDESIEDIDEQDFDEPEYVSEYVKDIYTFLREKEKLCPVNANYMRDKQSDVTPNMRGILVDWLADVALKFHLLSDTTHMTVMLVDRYLGVKENVSRKRLQLVGVSCMLIASKFEEIFAPEVNDFVYICDHAFSNQEVLDMETDILNTLHFDLCHPTAIHFLRRFSKAARSDSECHTLAKYLVELSVVYYESLTWPPSMLAASAVWVARSMHHTSSTPFVWGTTMAHYTGYTLEQLETTVCAIIRWAREAESAKLNAVYRKYCKRFFGVASIPVPDDFEEKFRALSLG